MLRKVLISSIVLFGCFCLMGATSVWNLGYYLDCVKGQVDILWKRQPIEKVIAQPDTPEPLKEKLKTVLAIRDFASKELQLPDNRSYRLYADIGRRYAVWNVVATPEFSVDPLQWCFPIAGCVSYRGFHRPEKAKDFADSLRAEGYDVYLYGVSAYSTLNWFSDPVLNTFIQRPAPYLAALIFHELAHQVVYVKDDSAFNEAFAKTVELEGVRRWLATQNNPAEIEKFSQSFRREEAFSHLVIDFREKLRKLYAQPLTNEAKRRAKEEQFAAFRQDYLTLKESWSGYSGFDRWMEKDLNNAKLVSISTYHDLVPAFRALLKHEQGDLSKFYSAVAELKQLSPSARREALASLQQQ